MKVKGKTLYHISRANTWQIGDTITAGQQYNPFWKNCIDFSPYVSVNGHKMPIFEMFDSVSTFDVTQQNIDFLYQNLKTVSKETSFYIREQVFETVRINSFPNLPSRQKCLWVTDYDQISYWKTMSQNMQRYLLTLELDGELFCGDDRWLTADTFSSVEYADRAMHYWSGDMSLSPRKEYLFYGQA